MRLPGRYDGVARPIVTYGSDPVLHRVCAPVTEFGEQVRRLLLDMFASMEAAEPSKATATPRQVRSMAANNDARIATFSPAGCAAPHRRRDRGPGSPAVDSR